MTENNVPVRQGHVQARSRVLKNSRKYHLPNLTTIQVMDNVYEYVYIYFSGYLGEGREQEKGFLQNRYAENTYDDSSTLKGYMRWNRVAHLSHPRCFWGYLAVTCKCCVTQSTVATLSRSQGVSFNLLADQATSAGKNKNRPSRV